MLAENPVIYKLFWQALITLIYLTGKKSRFLPSSKWILDPFLFICGWNVKVSLLAFLNSVFITATWRQVAIVICYFDLKLSERSIYSLFAIEMWGFGVKSTKYCHQADFVVFVCFVLFFPFLFFVLFCFFVCLFCSF